MTLMGKEQELRPCPLCHRNVEAVQDDHDHKANGPWYIECLCGIEMHDSQPDRLAARWNRRSSSDEAEVGLTIAGVTIPLTEPSPSGVKAGVTEAQIEAARLAAWEADGRSGFGYPLSAKAMRAALRALGVGDDGMGEAERLASLVDELADREKPGRAKLVLMIAARAVRRGSLLTAAEQLDNVDRFLAEGEDADAVPSK